MYLYYIFQIEIWIIIIVLYEIEKIIFKKENIITYIQMYILAPFII